MSLDSLGLTIAGAAEILAVTRETLNNLVNGTSGISADRSEPIRSAGISVSCPWLGSVSEFKMRHDLPATCLANRRGVVYLLAASRGTGPRPGAAVAQW